jgi:hypothetical protein
MPVQTRSAGAPWMALGGWIHERSWIMFRKLRVFGPALVVAVAVVAVAASSASAFEFFEREKESTVAFRGEQTESVEFIAAGGKIVCTEGSIRGMYVPEAPEKLKTKTISTSDESGKAGVIFGTCKYQAETATFTSNHCNFRYNAEKLTIDVIANGTVAEENECKEKGMVFTSKAGCTVTIKVEAANTGLKTNEYKNQGKGAEQSILFEPAVKKITYTSAKCLTNGTFANGEYLRGNLDVKGFTGTTFAVQQALFMG